MIRKINAGLLWGFCFLFYVGFGCVVAHAAGVAVCLGIAAVKVGRILWIGECVFVVENVVEYVK
jgi:hypothetical protein